jgi:hypothetical protein
MHRDADLFEIVLALTAARGLSRRLHRRKQQCDQHSDDRNYYE